MLCWKFSHISYLATYCLQSNDFLSRKFKFLIQKWQQFPDKIYPKASSSKRCSHINRRMTINPNDSIDRINWRLIMFTRKFTICVFFVSMKFNESQAFTLSIKFKCCSCSVFVWVFFLLFPITFAILHFILSDEQMFSCFCSCKVSV